jgi:hypothetical protein
MYKDVLRDISGVEIFAIIGLILFIAVFLAFAAYSVFIKKPLVEHLESLPLENDETSPSFTENRR